MLTRYDTPSDKIFQIERKIYFGRVHHIINIYNSHKPQPTIGRRNSMFLKYLRLTSFSHQY